MYSGVELARALFFFFFSRSESALRGVPNAKEHMIPFV
jgi:hypothetical protein